MVGKLGTMLVHANASTGPRTKAGAGDRTCACASFPCMGDVPQGSYLNSVAPLHFQGLGQPTTVNRQPPTANRQPPPEMHQIVRLQPSPDRISNASRT